MLPEVESHRAFQLAFIMTWATWLKTFVVKSIFASLPGGEGAGSNDIG
jgi:hypothetical protein